MTRKGTGGYLSIIAEDTIVIKIISEATVENSRAAEMSQPPVNLLSSNQSLPRHLKLGHHAGWSVGELVVT